MKRNYKLKLKNSNIYIQPSKGSNHFSFKGHTYRAKSRILDSVNTLGYALLLIHKGSAIYRLNRERFDSYEVVEHPRGDIYRIKVTDVVEDD